jgi:hypothetical protein
MDYLIIDGWTVPVKVNSFKGALNIIGETTPAFDGSPLETRRAEMEALSFKAYGPTITQQNGDALRGLLAGRGHIWQFDTSLYSSKGLPATLTAAGGAVYGNGKFQATISTDKAIQITAGASESLKIPANILNKTEQKWSIYMLFNPSELQISGGKTGYLWECYIGANNYYRLLVAETGKAYAEIKAGGDTYTASSASMPAMEIGTWYYICLTADGEHLNLYSNGAVIAADVDYVEPGGTLPTYFWVGSDRNGANHAGGLIDQLIIAPYVMSADQIAALYALTIRPSNYPTLNVTGDKVRRLATNPAQYCGKVDGYSDYYGNGQILQEVDFTLNQG